MLKRVLTAILAAGSSISFGQVVPSVSIDPSSPVGRVTADIFVDLEPTDAWTVSGVRALTLNGATFRYGGSDDPNTPYPDQIEGPYNGDPVTDRFVTSVSRPRPVRASDNRFNNNEGATILGRYSPEGPLATTVASTTELNVVWFSDPPVTSGSPSVDGYIARIALDFVLPAGATLGTSETQFIPPAATVILLSEGHPTRPTHLGFLTSSFDVPQLVGFDWAIWYVPEPGTALGIAVVAASVALMRRR